MFGGGGVGGRDEIEGSLLKSRGNTVLIIYPGSVVLISLPVFSIIGSGFSSPPMITNPYHCNFIRRWCL